MTKRKEIKLRALSFVMAVLGSATLFHGCTKQNNKQPVETVTSSYSDNGVSNTDSDVIVVPTKDKMVYVYEKIDALAESGLDAEVGKTIKLAKNDLIAKDAYSAIENENCISITDINFVDENTDLLVKAVAGYDSKGNFYVNYNTGATNNKDDAAMAVLVAYEGKNLGWVADMDYYLAQNLKYESETTNSDDKLLYTYEIPENKQINDNYLEIGEPYLFKAR